MPFKSEAQRRYMHANLPELAAKWEQETRKGAKLPLHVKATKTHRRKRPRNRHQHS